MKTKKVTYGNDNYKKQLAEFMQSVNPKPTLEQIEQLKQQYLAKRTQ
ncbi:hypothetical protein J1P26_17290 [Neobacillus sp. MM2021_6]|nr:MULTISPECIES: hypothetical protein [Bacillaceae]MBO0961463.1 hypothetical protein [Neobacillus sp. MM2021_6]NHC19568.1 hypothetical protein [Bacillus sp. MM2020_4]